MLGFKAQNGTFQMIDQVLHVFFVLIEAEIAFVFCTLGSFGFETCSLTFIE